MQYAVIVMLMMLIRLDQSPARAASVVERESLRGLPGVQLVIEDIARDAQVDGLSQDAIRTAAELILRSSSIPVLTQIERMKTPAAPYLYVRVTTYKSQFGLYAYGTKVALKQEVSLVGMPQQTMFAFTWEDESLGTSGYYDIGQAINPVQSSVKAFVNDFLTVNPR